MGENKLLEIRNLSVEFATFAGTVHAVDRVTLHINEGETVGMVGESGCGKSTVALAIMRLLPTPPARIKSGEIIFEGENLLKKSEEEMRQIRGGKISMIFQEPMTSLNPVYTIGKQISEAIIVHKKSLKRRGKANDHRDVKACENTQSREKILRISAPTFRWHATKSDDSNGFGLQPKTFDRR